MNQPIRVGVVKAWPGPAGVCYWTGRDGDGNLHRFVHNHAGRVPVPGEVWSVVGEPRHHPEYGIQLHVKDAVLHQPRGRLIVDFLARHQAFDGLRIGTTKATALYTYFGEALYDVLSDGNADRLAEVDKIPKEIIPRLIQAWQSVSLEANVIRWLSGWDCPLNLARKLVEVYGGQTIDRLNDNPYRLLAFVSFKKCDAIASRLGIAADDPRRMAAIVQHVLYQELEQGHTFSRLESLKAEASKFLVSGGTPDSALAAAMAAKVVIVSDDKASLTGIRMLELDAMARFDQMLAAPEDAQMGLFNGEAAVSGIMEEFEAENGYCLNNEQKEAIVMATKERLSIICGGAGVGKTTVLKALAKTLKNEIYLMALTGQAARRITQATDRFATTIEYFLRHIVGNISHNARPLLVIDEASMLDLQLTTRILRSCPKHSRLLLVGDPAQLPPVNFGLIFHKLAESDRVRKIELTTINRQTEESGIPGVSRQIRIGQMPSLAAYVGMAPGVSFISASRSDVMQRILDVKSDLTNSQILSIKNAGGLGVQDINEVFHRIKSVGRLTEESIGMSVREPVIFKKNVTDLDLVNGSLGRITGFERDENGSLQVLGSFAGEKKVITSAYLEYLKLAYAITVHSAQGSQFDRVIIIVEPSQILDRTLIYTALTRGIKQVVFIGDHQAFARAIRSKPKASERSVLFTI